MRTGTMPTMTVEQAPAEFAEGDVTNICGFKIGGFRDLI
jgi:hypothetical protein